MKAAYKSMTNEELKKYMSDCEQVLPGLQEKAQNLFASKLDTPEKRAIYKEVNKKYFQINNVFEK